MTSLLLMVYVASEVAKDSTIEFAVNSQEVNRIKAYYSARNSMDLALLRIKIYQQASRLNLPAGFAQQINQIWTFPMMWPFELGENASIATKDSVESSKKESLFDGYYTQTISDEGSKIDVNDLASPSKTLRDTTKQQLLNIFENRKTSDDAFRDQYANFNFEELVNRIADWMSDKNTSLNGGDKKQAYSQLGEGYPPNRGFRTLDEIRLVPGMNEEFFNMLKPSITIYGSKAINPNTANVTILKSLDTGITEEVINEVLERRNNPENQEGDFKGSTSDECRDDFKKYIEARGARLSAEFDKIPFQCDKVTNFKIEAIGRSGEGKGASQRKITAYIVDIQKAASVIKDMVAKEKQQQQQSDPSQPQQPTQTGPKTNTQKQEPLPKGRPRIVYWFEE
ncbi:MAG: general secretion pathway protein GspK [Pseudobdellovibrio sp.]